MPDGQQLDQRHVKIVKTDPDCHCDCVGSFARLLTPLIQPTKAKAGWYRSLKERGKTFLCWDSRLDVDGDWWVGKEARNLFRLRAPVCNQLLLGSNPLHVACVSSQSHVRRSTRVWLLLIEPQP